MKRYLNVPKSKTRFKKITISILLLIIAISTINGFITSMPDGVSVEGKVYNVSDVDFLYDLTYQKDNKTVHEQHIFNKVYKIINDAEKFIVVDMFLFNDDYDRKYQFPELALQLTNTLIAKKEQSPDVEITFITDEINTFYGAYPSKYLDKLKKNGINVVVTDLNALRDSNPVYSGFWRTFIQRLGTSGKGWLPNPFSPDSPKVTLRAYMKLLNFKANHRKIIASEKTALVSSANPHDASGYHSNIAFEIDGEIINDIIAAEKAIGRFSGSVFDVPPSDNPPTAGDIEARLLTEGKIKKHLVESIEQTKAGELIQIGMFYLSERSVINELIAASKRGVNIQIILDASKDAFGREKNGIPNRPVAAELYKKSNGAIKIRWYNTQGEQFHTKLVMIKSKDMTTIYGGSANLTRRNIGDYNLEADLKLVAPNDSRLVQEMSKYFSMLWDNIGGDYTIDFAEYAEKSLVKTILYRFQEWSGVGTF